jgi:hypothetical protein
MEYHEKESPVPLLRIEGSGNSEVKGNEAGVSGAPIPGFSLKLEKVRQVSV